MPIAFAGIAVAERRLVWKATFLDLLGHAFLDFVGEVVDVVLGQEHHHPEGELAGRVVRKVLLPEQRLRRQLVDGEVVAEVAAESVNLLADDGAKRRIMASGLNHPRELTATGLLGRLDVNELLDDLEAMALRVLVNALQLNRDRVAFALLLLRRDASVGKGWNSGGLHGSRVGLSVDLLRLHAASSPSHVERSGAPSIEPFMRASKSMKRKRLPSISASSASVKARP